MNKVAYVGFPAQPLLIVEVELLCRSLGHTTAQETKTEEVTMSEVESNDEKSNSTESLLGGHSSVASTATKLSSSDGSQRGLSDKESRRIVLSKLLLVLTILVSATSMAFFVYYYTSALEQSKFEKQVRLSES